jgi:uracil phosphoribosyltransferase
MAYRENVTIYNHPLIQHKLSILRDVRTTDKQFRELVGEITMLMTFEATRDLPLEPVDVTTPMGIAHAHRLQGENLALVPILRAGIGMVDGILELIPAARVGHIGLYRDEETLEPHEYYCKLPVNIDHRLIIVLDPMLATGGSAVDAITLIKQHGGKKIKFMCIIAAPEGIEKLSAAHPDVDIYCAHVDEKLNDIGYIVPGLGDAGDRIFGTK